MVLCLLAGHPSPEQALTAVKVDDSLDSRHAVFNMQTWDVAQNLATLLKSDQVDTHNMRFTVAAAPRMQWYRVLSSHLLAASFLHK